MTPKENLRQVRVLQEVADTLFGCKFRSDYSGRGMYGKLCCAITCDYAIAVIEICAQKGIKGAMVDDMGKGQIVYWPDISITQFKED